jgi:putative folate metabolism CADD family protein
MNHYLDPIDNEIETKHLLKHPFYLAWTRGELSKEALTDYARQYYRHVAAFPTYLSAVHANCDDQATRKQLLSNLIDEEAGSPNHSELWLKFAEGLGVSDVDVRESGNWPETKNLIETFRSVCADGSTAEGVAALYAYESQIPAICESKILNIISISPSISRPIANIPPLNAKCSPDISTITISNPLRLRSLAFSMPSGKCSRAFAGVTPSRVDQSARSNSFG